MSLFKSDDETRTKMEKFFREMYTKEAEIYIISDEDDEAKEQPANESKAQTSSKSKKKATQEIADKGDQMIVEIAGAKEEKDQEYYDKSYNEPK
jgi:uncharacterized protein (DUF1697 family)